MGWLDSILQFDSNLFLQLNGTHSPWWDTAMLFFTRKETWLAFYLILIWAIFREYGKKGWFILFILILGVVASDQLSTLLKELTQRLRPGHEPALEGMVHIVLRKGGLYGFVSSHAANTFIVLTFTALLFRNRYSFFPILIWALLVSYSRIYNGNHYPLDVLGGWVSGIILGFAFYKLIIWSDSRMFVVKRNFLDKTCLSNKNAIPIFLVIAVIIVTVLVIVKVLHKYNLLA